LLEYANKNGILDLIDNDLIFENASTNKIKTNHIKTMLCGNFVGIDKLERLKLLQCDPLINEFAIPEGQRDDIRSKNRKRYRAFWRTSATKQPKC